MLAFGEIEALVAAFARLLLFVLFPGTLLRTKQTKTKNSYRCVEV